MRAILVEESPDTKYGLSDRLMTAVYNRRVHPDSFTNADALRGLDFQPRSYGTEITIFFVWDEGQTLPSIFIRVSGRRASDEPAYELFQVVEATEAEIFAIVRSFMPNIGELVETARDDLNKAIKKLGGLERFETRLAPSSTGQASESAHNIVRGARGIGAI